MKNKLSETHDMPQKEIRALTGVRGFAALAVVSFHFFNTGSSLPLLNNFLARSYMFVDLFFVLSGLVMAMNYTSLFSDGFSIRNYRTFLAKRFARIYPLYFTLTLLMATWQLMKVIVRHQEFDYILSASNFLLIQAWGIGKSLVGPAWSISTECATYIVLPALLAVVVFSKKWLCTIAVAALLLLLYLVANFRPVLPEESLQNGTLNVWVGSTIWPLVRCVVGFSIGLFLFRVSKTKWAGKILKSDVLAVLSMVGLIWIFASHVPDLVAYPFLVLVIFFCHGESKASELVFGNRIVYAAGLWSYSIYLVHAPLLGVSGYFRDLGDHYLGRGGYGAASVVWYILLILLARSAYQHIELRGRKYVMNLWQRNETKLAAMRNPIY